MNHEPVNIKNLLINSFNYSELKGLAFTLFPNLHENLNGMRHDTAAETITDHTYRQGKEAELLAYIKSKNRHQYSRYMEKMGDDALVQEDFEGAILAYRETEANQKLENALAAKKRATITRLSNLAVTYETTESWQDAEKTYRELRAIDNDNQRWIEGVDRSEKEQILSDLYEEAVTLNQAHKYREAEEKLQRIINIRATYRDAAQMLANIVANRKGEPPVDKNVRTITNLNKSNIILGGIGLLLVAISASFFIFRYLVRDEPGLVTDLQPTATVTFQDTPFTASIEETEVSPEGIVQTIQSTPSPTITPTSQSTDTSEPVGIEQNTQIDLDVTPGATLVPLSSIDDAMARFQERGYIIVGVRADAPPFGVKSGDQFIGFDIDIAREFALRWLGDSNAIQFVEVSTKISDDPTAPSERIVALLENEVDFIVAAFTSTSERCSKVECSQIYFQDGARLLVQKDSNILGPADLDGKPVAVIENTTAEDNINNLSRIIAYETPPYIISYETRDAAIQALKDGRVVAYSTDGEILEQYADDLLHVVGGEFSSEPYTIGIPPQNKGTTQLINITLQAMKQDGWYQSIYETYFACETPFRIDVPSDVIFPAFVKNSQIVELTCRNSFDLTEANTHIISAGETLGGIAKLYYGDYNFFPCIQHASEIVDVRIISIGTELILPSEEGCTEYLSETFEQSS